MQQQVNYFAWAGLSLAIFLGLLFVSNLATRHEIKSTSVQQAYDELAAALDAAGILPGVGEGEMFSAFAGQTFDKGKLRAPSPGPSGTIELKLGNVLSAKFRDGQATYIEIHPGNYKQLTPGALRNALKKINRLPYSMQVEQLAGAATKSFTVSVIQNGVHYIISPGFNNQQCTSLVVN